MAFNKSKTVTLGILFLIPLLFFHLRGISYNDEGYILHSAQRILNGQIPYKDFQIIYTPGSFLFISLIFKIFGQSVFVERLAMLIISLFTIFIIYLLMRKINFNFAFMFIPILAYLFWGPGHINFAWPVMFTIVTSFVVCLFFIKSLEKNTFQNLLLAGVFTSLTFLFKQNFGIAIFFNSLLALVFIKEIRSLKFMSIYLLGIITILLAFFAYLLLNNAFFDFLDTIKIRLIDRVIMNKTIDTPFIFQETHTVKEFVKLIFYLIPFFASIVALGFSIKRKYKYFFLSTFTLLYYVFGIRPTTDYIHLVPLLSVTGVSFAITLKLSNTYLLKAFIISLAIAFIGLGLYSSLYKEYYKWQAPLIENNNYLNYPKINTWVDSKYNFTIPLLSEYIKTHTKKDEYIFINHYSPFLYFSSDRINATEYDYLSPNELLNYDQQRIISSLKKKNVNLIVTSMFEGKLENDNSKVAIYIKANYKPRKTVSEFIFWNKK